jgi:hypothetical protein
MALISPFTAINSRMICCVQECSLGKRIVWNGYLTSHPHQGVMKQMYLESKSVEVLVLWLEQAQREASEPRRPKSTQPRSLHLAIALAASSP